MASAEQYEDRPRDYTEGSPDVAGPVGGERSTAGAYEMPSAPVPDDQQRAGADYDDRVGPGGNDRYRDTAYDQSRPDFTAGDDRDRGQFGERWSGEPTGTAGEQFGAAWSNEADVTEVKAEEFGERWAAGPDDSAVRSEEFGAAWSGENQPDREEGVRDV